MIANVHVEHGSSLGNLRERLRNISGHWLVCSDGLGIIIGDFNICEPEKGMFHVPTQTFSDGDPGRSAAFRSIFHTPCKKAQPSFTRKAALDGTLRILFLFVRASINIPMAEVRDLNCHAHATDDLDDRS